MVWGVQQVEEVEAEPGEHPTLVGDGLVEDYVIGRDPVGGHEEEVVGVDLVDLPDLSRCDVWECQHAAAA
jgi:hypothetical protein